MLLKSFNLKYGEKFMTELMRQQILKQLPSFRSEMFRRVEHIDCFVVFRVDHALSSQVIDIAIVIQHYLDESTSLFFTDR